MERSGSRQTQCKVYALPLTPHQTSIERLIVGSKLNIAIKDLDSVKHNRGYYIGELKEDHQVFTYLRKGALVMITDSVQAVFRSFKELNWTPQQGKASDNRGTNDYNKFNSLAEAIDTFTNNPRSVRTFKEEDIKLTAEEAIGKDVEFDVTGDYIDIGRFLEGQPESFGIAHNGNPSNLHATVLFNVSTPWYVSEDLLNHRAARMLRLVDWMESQGVRCQIRAFESTECAHMDIKVKGFEDAVDMNSLAVATHSDFLRRVSFLVAEQSKTWGSGYGNATSFTNRMMSNYVAEQENGLTVFITEIGSITTEDIDKNFDKLRDKIIELITTQANRDFTKIYSVNLKG